MYPSRAVGVCGERFPLERRGKLPRADVWLVQSDVGLVPEQETRRGDPTPTRGGRTGFSGSREGQGQGKSPGVIVYECAVGRAGW